MRTHLSILEEKGHLTHSQDGPRYVYRPTVPRQKASESALQSLLKNFFEGSRERVVRKGADSRDELLAEIAGLVRWRAGGQPPSGPGAEAGS